MNQIVVVLVIPYYSNLFKELVHTSKINANATAKPTRNGQRNHFLALAFRLSLFKPN